jgi:hypothetical protein
LEHARSASGVPGYVDMDSVLDSLTQLT